jgi:membrane protease YdiL (CAAX protease family)
LLGILSAIIPGKIGEAVYSFLRIIFAFVPVAAVFITRFVTKDKSAWNFDIKVWRNKRTLLLCAFLPAAIIFLGAAFYYLVFPHELFINIQSLFDFCAEYGLPNGIPVNGRTVAITMIIIWIASAVALPIHFRALGEEIGWRGFLLPKMLSFMSVRKAVLLNAILWGIVHTPDIAMGFNYGTDYWGAPITGIVVFMLFCICTGICLSYITIKTNNCMYAAIFHGAINVAADMQILTVAFNKPLIGPQPTGIIGMSVFIIVAGYIFIKKLSNTVE